jgi:hypothetical protein
VNAFTDEEWTAFSTRLRDWIRARSGAVDRVGVLLTLERGSAPSLAVSTDLGDREIFAQAEGATLLAAADSAFAAYDEQAAR